MSCNTSLYDPLCISPSIVLEENWEHNIYGNVKHEGIQMSVLCALHVMSLGNQLWWVLTYAVTILILIDLSTMVAAEWCMHSYNQSTGLVWIRLNTSSPTIEHTGLVGLCYGLMKVKYESKILLALPWHLLLPVFIRLIFCIVELFTKDFAQYFWSRDKMS